MSVRHIARARWSLYCESIPDSLIEDVFLRSSVDRETPSYGYNTAATVLRVRRNIISREECIIKESSNCARSSRKNISVDKHWSWRINCTRKRRIFFLKCVITFGREKKKKKKLTFKSKQLKKLLAGIRKNKYLKSISIWFQRCRACVRSHLWSVRIHLLHVIVIVNFNFLDISIHYKNYRAIIDKYNFLHRFRTRKEWFLQIS